MMDFDYWIKECDKFPSQSEEVLRASDKMAERAKTFDQWRNVYYRTQRGSVFERTAFLQMATLAKTFGQWLNIYQESMQDEVVHLTAMREMIKLADDPEDAKSWAKDMDTVRRTRWIRIFEVSPLSSELELRASQKIIELMLKKKNKEAKEQEDQSYSKI